MKFSTSLVASLLASVACAVPHGPGKPPGPPAPPQPRGPATLSRLASQTPKNTLPPPTGLQLKYVMLGIGTQNYTCTPGNDTAVPGTTGAVATVYDIGTRLNTDPMAQWKIGSISGLALSLSAYPKILEGYLQSQGYQKILGQHYFTQTTPTFSLNKVLPLPYPIAFVTKDDAMDAPKSSCPGTKNEGAVKWLKLSDKDGRSQGAVNTVYRLETAGGSNPPTCKGMKATFEVPYAAQYWVYGPTS
ncbi:hypothetical protein EJ04DRAFT_469465 [Polyplosphaeria fusca]|uniref:Malate dehydrogenase n=1 Tax=Polyplosphaeria fusca TaxID=682080 RepID=A0A9P4QXT1_9PLEO|nr:hypothetical protein EJ04DRAFT_469465 [Polyplosphaeria fusca]